MSKAPLSVRVVAHARRVVQKLGSLTIGAAYVSPRAVRLRRRRDGDVAPRSVAAAVVAHVFYPELLDEILDCHAMLPDGADLIVTAPAEKLRLIERKIAGRACVRLVEVPNRGRDIAPFLALLNAGDLDRYDVVLKLHTKRSPHLLDGDIRRRLLYAILAGTRRRTDRILSFFDDPATGMVGWKTSWRTSVWFWMGDRDRVAGLASAMRTPMPPTPAFFEGSMFWVRPKALARLVELGLGPDAFEAEAGQLDGTLHHAIERCFSISMHADGYVVRSTAGELLLAPKLLLVH